MLSLQDASKQKKGTCKCRLSIIGLGSSVALSVSLQFQEKSLLSHQIQLLGDYLQKRLRFRASQLQTERFFPLAGCLNYAKCTLQYFYSIAEELSVRTAFLVIDNDHLLKTEGERVTGSHISCNQSFIKKEKAFLLM
jgi:hypothetical protein